MKTIPEDSAATQELLQRVAAGDSSALDRLFAQYRPYLRRIVEARFDRQIAPRVDPSDIIQDTQLGAARRIGGFLAERPMPFRLWLRKAAQESLSRARRRHVDVGRRAVARETPLPDQTSLQLADQLMGTGSSPSDRVNRKELARKVRQALAILDEADREILLLRNFEVLSYAEAATVLDIEPGTARKRYGRALLRLDNLLRQAGLTESQL